MVLSGYEKIDKKIFSLAIRAQSLGYFEAKNSQEEKEKFLKGKIRIPRFIYKDSSYNTDKLNTELTKLEVPDDEIGDLYKGLVRELYLRNEIVANLGRRKLVVRNSEVLYGRPSKKLLALAKKELRDISKKSEFNKYDKKKLNYKDIKKKLRRFVNKLGINDWKVLGTNRHSTSVAAVRRQIKVSRYKRYTQSDLRLLKAHEVNGHVLRAENGFRQPFRIFAMGLPGYLSTEEGICAYLEKKYKIEDLNARARFALRVFAVEAVYRGLKFNQCFDLINEYEEDRNKCWEITYRVFRGGGFLKDHVYFKGYHMVKDYIRKGGKLKYLYVGKIGIKHLKLVKKLVKKKVLVKPKYLPERSI